jgi:hypothetical protein
MPSKQEIEAAAKALEGKGNQADFCREDAEAALTAAEKVRGIECPGHPCDCEPIPDEAVEAGMAVHDTHRCDPLILKPYAEQKARAAIEAGIQAAAPIIRQQERKRIAESEGVKFRVEAEAALTAAEQVRAADEDAALRAAYKRGKEVGEARTQGDPIKELGDLQRARNEELRTEIEARTQANEDYAATRGKIGYYGEARTQPCCRHGFPDQACEPETGQPLEKAREHPSETPIPDEAVEAAVAEDSRWFSQGRVEQPEHMRRVLEAAAPIIRAQVLTENAMNLADAFDKGKREALAEAKVRVEGLKQNDPGEFYVGYDEAIDDALTAIDGSEK